MQNGIYSVRFSSTAGALGTGGVAFFIDGNVYGGDAHFYYKGTVNVSGGSVSSGSIHVGQHQKGGGSIFGPLTDFDLQVTGTATDNSFSLTGNVVGHPGQAIKVDGHKVADL
jgi:T3SS negative regulator,GrlR